MKKRLVALLLVGAMTAGMLAGCGKGEEGVQSSNSNSTSAVAKDESSNAGNSSESVKEEEKKPEITTVKILCTNDMSADVKTKDWENYEVSQVFIKELEEIGVRLEVECVDGAALDNVIATRMAAGVDLPDLISYPNDASDKVYEFAKSGLVYPVNELLEQYDEDGSVKKYYDETAPGVWERVTAPDGNIYWFSYLYGELEYIDVPTGEKYTGIAPRALQVRENWVEAVGEELKDVYTPDELFDLLLKINKEDANGNGKNDEVVAVSISDFANGIASGFGLTKELLCGYFVDENKVFSNFYHENFPAYIEFMKKLYDNDLYDTAALSGADQMRLENRASLAWGYASADHEKDLTEIDPNVQYNPIYFDLDGDLTNGFCMFTDSPGPRPYYNYFVPKNCENPEGVARLMDYVYTDEYALLDRYGIEGETWEYSDEYGVPLTKEGFNMTEHALWGSGIGLKALPAIVKWGGLKERHKASDLPTKYDKAEWHIQFRLDYGDIASLEYGLELAIATDEELAIMNEYQAVLETYASELLTDLILGEKSLDDLPKYQKEMEDLGLSKYLEVIQARRSRVVGN